MSDSANDKTIVLGGAAGIPPGARPPAAHMAESHNGLPVNTILGEFEIIGLVGEGGFGIVYLAYDHSLERKVALKEYMPSSLASRGPDSRVSVRSERHRETFEMGRRSFVNEARLLAQFDHPALVKVYRFWEDKGTAYMAMPYYDGITLRDALKARGAPPEEGWIRKILLPLMEALEVIHAESCFHRDIAPDNVMLLRDDRPVLLDFGAARRVIGDMTQALTVILKPGYAPVEQYAEMPDMKQGAWTDIYALGAVVYFMILGRTPPPSVGRLMKDTYQPLSQLAAGRYSDIFLRGIDHCLAVKAADRPQSIAAMREILGFSSPAGEAAAPQPAASPAEPPTVLLPPAAMQDEATRVIPRPADVPMPASPASVAHAAPLAEPAGGRKSLTVLLGGGALALAAVTAYFVIGTSGKTPPPAATPTATPSPAPLHSPPVTVATPPTPVPAPLASVSPAADWSGAVRETLSAAERPISVDHVKTPVVVGRDALSFALRSEHEGFVYLFLLDHAENKLSLIFPNALDANNHLAADKPMNFPRESWTFSADQPVGEWEVLVMVADSKRDFASLGLISKDGIASAPLARVEAALSPGALAGRPQCGKSGGKGESACSAAYGAQRFKVMEVAPGKG